VTDFPLTFALIRSFSYAGELSALASAPSISPDKAVCLANCHDSVLGDAYRFGDETDSILAACFLLARGRGIPLIYSTQLKDPRVQAGIKFCNLTLGLNFKIREDSDKTLLLIQRGDRGLVIINKSADWNTRDSLTMYGFKTGIYKELVYGVKVKVHVGSDNQPWVQTWGDLSGGFKIGPREIHFVIFERD